MNVGESLCYVYLVFKWRQIRTSQLKHKCFVILNTLKLTTFNLAVVYFIFAYTSFEIKLGVYRLSL